MIARFRAEKDRRGLLDYDDLIDKTLDLLKDERAAWVHYKLDRGIHHVLIDEAQDTSPKQWEIVKALVGEFFAGAGAHERPRTIFAVGDEKQSIFSFQGAAPREFAAMRLHFEQAHRRASLDFIATEFKHSFRSGPNVLGAVDTVFARVEAFAGLTADIGAADPRGPAGCGARAGGNLGAHQVRRAGKKAGLGRAVRHPDRDQRHGEARATASPARSRRWQRQGRRPKDVLILVRRRGALFEAIIRALKNEDIPVAGADRLVLTEHIAVMDLMVLADALLLPEDDLALATVLKSPLFGLDDDELFKLAWDRKGSLRCVRCARSGPSWRPSFRRDRASARASCRRSPSTPGCSAPAGPAQNPRAARPRGQRRARRIPQSRARLRTRGDAVAARLRRLAARGGGRGQARHGDGARRGAGDDRARRQGAGSADRHPRRHHDAAAGLASAAAAAAAAAEAGAGRAGRLVWAGAEGQRCRPDGGGARGGARRRRATNTGGCFTWR